MTRKENPAVACPERQISRFGLGLCRLGKERTRDIGVEATRQRALSTAIGTMAVVKCHQIMWCASLGTWSRCSWRCSLTTCLLL